MNIRVHYINDLGVEDSYTTTLAEYLGDLGAILSGDEPTPYKHEIEFDVCKSKSRSKSIVIPVGKTNNTTVSGKSKKQGGTAHGLLDSQPAQRVQKPRSSSKGNG